MTKPPRFVGPAAVEYRAGKAVLVDQGTGVVIAEASCHPEHAPMPEGGWPVRWCGMVSCTRDQPAHGFVADGFTHWCSRSTRPEGTA